MIGMMILVRQNSVLYRRMKRPINPRVKQNHHQEEILIRLNLAKITHRVKIISLTNLLYSRQHLRLYSPQHLRRTIKNPNLSMNSNLKFNYRTRLKKLSTVSKQKVMIFLKMKSTIQFQSQKIKILPSRQLQIWVRNPSKQYNRQKIFR